MAPESIRFLNICFYKAAFLSCFRTSTFLALFRSYYEVCGLRELATIVRYFLLLIGLKANDLEELYTTVIFLVHNGVDMSALDPFLEADIA